jgi:hypothetical protein
VDRRCWPQTFTERLTENSTDRQKQSRGVSPLKTNRFFQGTLRKHGAENELVEKLVGQACQRFRKRVKFDQQILQDQTSGECLRCGFQLTHLA